MGTTSQQDDGVIKIGFEYKTALNQFEADLKSLESKYFNQNATKTFKIAVDLDFQDFDAAIKKINEFSISLAEEIGQLEDIITKTNTVADVAKQFEAVQEQNKKTVAEYQAELKEQNKLLSEAATELNNMKTAAAKAGTGFNTKAIKEQTAVVEELRQGSMQLVDQIKAVDEVAGGLSTTQLAKVEQSVATAANGSKSSVEKLNKAVAESKIQYDSLVTSISNYRNILKAAKSEESTTGSGSTSAYVTELETQINLLTKLRSKINSKRDKSTDSYIVTESELALIETYKKRIEELIALMNKAKAAESSGQGIATGLSSLSDTTVVEKYLSTYGEILSQTSKVKKGVQELTAQILTEKGTIEQVTLAYNEESKQYQATTVQISTAKQVSEQLAKAQEEEALAAQKLINAQNAQALAAEKTAQARKNLSDQAEQNIAKQQEKAQASATAQYEKAIKVVEKLITTQSKYNELKASELSVGNSTETEQLLNQRVAIDNLTVTANEYKKTLTTLFDQGLISGEQYNQFLKQLQEGMTGSADSVNKITEAVTASQNAFNTYIDSVEKTGESLKQIDSSSLINPTDKFSENFVEANTALQTMEKLIADIRSQGGPVSADDISKLQELESTVQSFVSSYNKGLYTTDATNSNGGILTPLTSSDVDAVKAYFDSITTGAQQWNESSIKIAKNGQTITAQLENEDKSIDKIILSMDNLNGAYRQRIEHIKTSQQALEKSLNTEISQYKQVLTAINKIESAASLNGESLDGNTDYDLLIERREQLTDAINSNIASYELQYGVTEKIQDVEAKWAAATNTTTKSVRDQAQATKSSEAAIQEYSKLLESLNDQIAVYSASESYSDSNSILYTNKVQELVDLSARLRSILGDDGLNILDPNTQTELEQIKTRVAELTKELSGSDYLSSNRNGLLTNLTSKDYQQAFDYISSHLGTIDEKTKKWASDGSSVSATIKDNAGQMQQVVMTFDEANNAYRVLITSVGESQGLFTTLKNTITSSFSYLSKYLFGYMFATQIIRGVQEGISVIEELDTALTEMRKVSDDSKSSLEDLQQTFFDLADSIGTTAADLSDVTADFMRIGESAAEAVESAETAAILYNVSEFESISEASDALVAVSQAYDELDKMEIVDIINELGNNYAIATDELSTALQTVSATMSLLGVSLEETSAMVTTANQTIQDESKVANGLRTVALRIFSTEEGNEELEAMGEEVDEFVTTTVAKKEEIIKSYTAVASNAHKGISIIDEETGTYRNLYDILLDIAEIYEEIQEEDVMYGTNRATALIEELAGKNRSNILSALLSNPDTLKASLESAENSAGSAEEELSKHLDSIAGKLEQLTNKAQEFWYNLIPSDVIKSILDVANGLMSVVTALGDINIAGKEINATLPVLVGLIESIILLLKSSGETGLFTSLVNNMPNILTSLQRLKTTVAATTDEVILAVDQAVANHEKIDLSGAFEVSGLKGVTESVSNTAHDIIDSIRGVSTDIDDVEITQSVDNISGSFDALGTSVDDNLNIVDRDFEIVDDAVDVVDDLSAEFEELDATSDAFDIDNLGNGFESAAESTETYSVGLDVATIKTKLLTSATKLLNIALSAFVTVAVLVAIQEIIGAIQDWIEAEDNLRDAMSDFNNDLSNTIDSIDEYKEKIQEQVDILNDDSATVEDAAEARAELITIQDDLIEQYGSEYETVRSVTQAIDGQVDALDRLKQAEYEALKEEYKDNGSDIDDVAQRASEGIAGFNLMFTVEIEELDEALQTLDSLTRYENGNTITYSINAGDVETQLSTLQEIQRIAEAINLADTFNESHLAEALEWAEDFVGAYGDILDMYMQFDENSGIDAYQDGLNDLADAYSAWNQARINDDEEATQSAIESFSNILNSLYDEAISNGDYLVASYIDGLYPTIESAVSEWEFQVKLNANVDDMADDLEEFFSLHTMTESQLTDLLESGDSFILSPILAESGLEIEEFVELMKELGYVASDTEYALVQAFGRDYVDSMSVSELNYALQLTQGEIDECEGSTEKLETAIQAVRDAEYEAGLAATSYSDTIISLTDNIQPQLEAIETLYAALADGSLDHDALAEFVDEFYDLDDEFAEAFNSTALENLIAVLTDSSSTVDDVTSSFDAMVTAWIEASGVLGELTDDNKAYVANLLESMGVQNAAEIVELSLIQTKADLKFTDEELAAVDDSVIEAFVNEEVAAEYAAQALAVLLLRKMALNAESVDYVSDADSILELAEAAGISSEALDDYKAKIDEFKAATASGASLAATEALETEIDELGEILLEEASGWTGIVEDYLVAGVENAEATIKDVVGDISENLEEQMDVIAEGYDAIFNGDDGFTLNIDNATIQSFIDTFENLEGAIGAAFDTTVLDEFIAVLSNTSSTADQVQDAFNALVTEYLDASGVLNDLNDETVDYIGNQLELIGIVNGTEIAEKALVSQKVEDIASTHDLANASDELIQELAEEAGGAEYTELALIQLKIAQILCNDNQIDMTDSINSILTLAQAAGVASNALNSLRSVYNSITTVESSLATAKANMNMQEIIELNRALDDLYDQAESLSGEIYEDITEIDIGYYTGTGGSSSGSSGGSTASEDAEDEAGSIVDAYEEAKEKLEMLRDRDKISERQYLSYLNALYEEFYGDCEDYLEEYAEEEREFLEDLKDWYEDVFDYIISLYEDRMDALKDECEAVVAALEAEKEAALAAYDAQIEAIEAEIEALEELIEEYEAMIEALEEQIEMLEDQIDALEDQKEEIQDQIDAIQDEIDAIEEANEERQRALDLETALYELERAKNQRTKLVYSAESGYTYEVDESAIADAEEDVAQAELEIQIAALEEEIAALEEIQDLIDEQIEAIEEQIEALEDEIDAIEDLIDEVEDQIDALEDEIDAIEELKDATEEYYDTLIEQTEEYYQSQIDALQEMADAFEELMEMYETAQMQQALLELGYTEEEVLALTAEGFERLQTQYLAVLAALSSGNEELQQQLADLAGMDLETLLSYVDLASDSFYELAEADITGLTGDVDTLTTSTGDSSTSVSELDTSLSNVSSTSSSTSGTLETIADAVQQIADNSSASIDILSQLASGLSAVGSDETVTGLSATDEQLGNIGNHDYTTTLDALAQVEQKASDVGTAAQNSDTQLVNLSTSVSNTGTAMSDTNVPFDELVENSAELVDLLPSATEATDDLSESLSDMVTEESTENLESIAESFDSMATADFTTVSDSITTMKDSLAEVRDTAEEVISTIGGLGDGDDESGTSLVSAFSSAAEASTTHTETMATNLNNVADAATSAVEAIGGALGGETSSGESGDESGESAEEGSATSIVGALSAAATASTTHSQTMVENFGEVTDAAMEVVSAISGESGGDEAGEDGEESGSSGDEEGSSEGDADNIVGALELAADTSDETKEDMVEDFGETTDAIYNTVAAITGEYNGSDEGAENAVDPKSSSGGSTYLVGALKEDLVQASEEANKSVQEDFDASTESIAAALAELQALVEQLNAMGAEIVSITVEVSTEGLEGEFEGTVGSAFAKGTVGHAYSTGKYPGLDEDTLAVRSEYGQPELTIYPNGEAELTTEPTMSKLPKDTVIFNEEQTNRIIGNKGTMLQSLAGGTIRELESDHFLRTLMTQTVQAVTASYYDATTGLVVKEMSDLINEMKDNNANRQITQTFNVTLPNVNDSTAAQTLLRDLQNIGARKYQYFG